MLSALRAAPAVASAVALLPSAVPGIAEPPPTVCHLCSSFPVGCETLVAQASALVVSLGHSNFLDVKLC